MREIILDTETTGLSFVQGDRIIEVGCVELHNHVPTGKTLQFFCNVQKKTTLRGLFHTLQISEILENVFFIVILSTRSPG